MLNLSFCMAQKHGEQQEPARNYKCSSTGACTIIVTILKIHWSDKTTNEELWEKTGQQPIEQEIRQRRWRWVGHTLRRPRESITRQALFWNPRKRGKGRPNNTWRQDLGTEITKTKRTWRDLERIPCIGRLGKIWLRTYASQGIKG